MRFDIYVTGQYSENYGSCWKPKGSDEQLVFPNVSLEKLPEAREAALKQCPELSYANAMSACRYDDVVLYPAGATPNVRFAIEHNFTEQCMRYENMNEDEIEMVLNWRRYFSAA